jgi:hypothetical protein
MDHFFSFGILDILAKKGFDGEGWSGAGKTVRRDRGNSQIAST